jgi:hypothetical protein
VHRLNASSVAETDPIGNRATHNEIACLVIAYLIYHLPPESNYDDGQEVYMVGQGEPPIDKTTKEITRAARFDQEAA